MAIRIRALENKNSMVQWQPKIIISAGVIISYRNFNNLLQVCCMTEQKVLVMVPVQSILLAPLSVKLCTLEYRHSFYRHFYRKSFYRKAIGLRLQNIDIGGEVLSQIGSWL